MSKIVCDICGTSYSDTEEQCPICGCAKDFSVEGLADEPVAEEIVETAPKAGLFAGASKRRKETVKEEDDFDDEEDFDDEDEEKYDEEDDFDEDVEDEDDDDDDDDEDDEEDHKSNAPLVILLVLVILALIAVSAFIFVKYFMPNVVGPETTAPSVIQTTEAATETTELRIPCESLALTSGGEIVLDLEGSNWLINVMALPENTTDELVYTSSDESVVTVNEQGKVTAVGEGTAVITITCGEQELKCSVTCDFTPETTAPETTAPSEPDEQTTEPSNPAEETTAPTEPEETTEPTEPLKNITLKVIKWTDLTFNGPNQGFTFQLDGLKNTEVKWTSMDTNVVTVDENGFVLSVGRGNTTIICQYGDQKVEIKVKCTW